jgi:hypothetical protein
MNFKKVWIGYNTEREGLTLFPYDNEDTETAVDEIDQLIKEGWKIVSTCPITATQISRDLKSTEYQTYTFTSGIEVFLVKE